MRTGNVVRDPHGDLAIVTDVHEAYDGKPGTVEWVAFWAENMSGVSRLDDHEREETCFCGDQVDGGEPSEDCETCHGEGRYMKKVMGWSKHAKVLAPHVKAFIQKRALKAFEID